MKKTLAVLVVLALCAALCASLTVSAAGTNLALNKSYTGADPSTHPNNVDKYTAKLTDGVVAEKLSFDPGAWFAYYCNSSATEDQINAPDSVGTMVIDLGATSKVDTVKVHAYVGTGNSGILKSKSMKVEVSTDNSTWKALGEVDLTNMFPDADGNSIDWIEIKGTAADARYVKLIIELNGVFSFLDEVEVYGEGGDDGKTDDTPSESKPAESKPAESKPATGDTGIVVFAVLGIAAVVGAFVATKKRAR